MDLPTQLAGASLDRATLSTWAHGKARLYCYSIDVGSRQGSSIQYSIDVGSRQGSSIQLLYRRGLMARLVRTVLYRRRLTARLVCTVTLLPVSAARYGVGRQFRGTERGTALPPQHGMRSGRWGVQNQRSVYCLRNRVGVKPQYIPAATSSDAACCFVG